MLYSFSHGVHMETCLLVSHDRRQIAWMGLRIKLCHNRMTKAFTLITKSLIMSSVNIGLQITFVTVFGTVLPSTESAHFPVLLIIRAKVIRRVVLVANILHNL
jgi:hypothetical protein